MHRPGFTLIELMVAVVLTGILAAVSVQTFRGSADRSNLAKMTGNVRQVAQALETYASEHDAQYPDWTWISTSGFIDKGYLPNNRLPISPWCTLAQTAEKKAVSSGADVWSDLQSCARLQKVPDAWGAGLQKASVNDPPSGWADAGMFRYNPREGSGFRVYELYGLGKLGDRSLIVMPVSNALN